MDYGPLLLWPIFNAGMNIRMYSSVLTKERVVIELEHWIVNHLET